MVSVTDSPQCHVPAVTLSAPLLFGYMINWTLYGILSVQVYLYYLAFPNDPKHNKAFVYAVYLLETLQSALIGRDAYVIFSAGFGNLNALIGVHYEWLTLLFIGNFVAAIVQMLYAYRIRILSKSWIVPSLVVVMAIVQYTGTFVDGILGYKSGSITKLNSPAIIVGHIVMNGASALCDIVIAIYMSYYLSRAETSFAETKVILCRLLQLVVGTGAVTAILSIVDLSLYMHAISNGGALYMISCTALGKLYSNSMMVMFNNRLQIVGGRNEVDAAANRSFIPSILFRATNSEHASIFVPEPSIPHPNSTEASTATIDYLEETNVKNM